MAASSHSNKRIAKNTLLLYFRMLLMMGISLYTSRVILNALGVVDFGIYNVVGGIVAMFSFFNGAMSSATQRFITFELGAGTFHKLNTIFCTSVLIHGLISLIIVILAETVGLWFLHTQMTIPSDRMNAALWVYQFSVLACIVMIMSTPYNATIIAHEKMSAFASISIIEVILKLLAAYLLIIFSYDKLKTYAILMFAIQMISRMAYGSYCSKYFSETKFHFIWDKNLFKEMFSFAGWTLNGSLAYISYTQGLNILLNIFFGPVVNAARGIAIQVQSAVMKFCQNFQLAVNPQITKTYASGNIEHMHQLIYASSKYSFFLIFLLTLPIMFETKQILIWWLRTVPDYTVVFIRITLVMALVDTLTHPMLTAVYSTGKIKRYQLWEGSILLLILPFSYLSLKLGYPPESVFVIHLVIAVIVQYVRVRIVAPMIQMSLKLYLKKVVIKIFYVSICSTLIPAILYFNLSQNIVTFYIMCSTCLLSTLISIYSIGLSSTEKSIVKEKILKYIHIATL